MYAVFNRLYTFNQLLALMWKWKYFSPSEVLSPEGLAELSRGILLFSPTLLDALEALREEIGKPIFINHSGLKYRGYRSPRENYEIVKGEKYSYHMMGLAADISCYDLKFEEFYAKVIGMRVFKGIGLYPKNRFIHADIRHSLTDSIVSWVK